MDVRPRFYYLSALDFIEGMGVVCQSSNIEVVGVGVVNVTKQNACYGDF